MVDVPIRFTSHASVQAERRGIAPEVVLEVVKAPAQVVPVRPGRESRQSLVDEDRYLLRVVVDVLADEVTIVTMYKTSKVMKFWQP